MIKSILAAGVAVALATSAMAQSVQLTPLGSDAPKAGGKIVLYRQHSMMGLALGCPIRYKGSEIVELGRGKYAEWEVPAGRYILTNKTSSVEVAVDPGETRYVRCTIKPGFMTGRADLQVVDQESFAEHSADYEKKEIAALVAPAS